MALKHVVKQNAERRWKDVGELPCFSFPKPCTWADRPGFPSCVSTARKNPEKRKSQRVLDIKPGSLCFVIGTVYMEMRLKPNILEELSREVRR